MKHYSSLITLVICTWHLSRRPRGCGLSHRIAYTKRHYFPKRYSILITRFHHVGKSLKKYHHFSNFPIFFGAKVKTYENSNETYFGYFQRLCRWEAKAIMSNKAWKRTCKFPTTSVASQCESYYSTRNSSNICLLAILISSIDMIMCYPEFLM